MKKTGKIVLALAASLAIPQTAHLSLMQSLLFVAAMVAALFMPAPAHSKGVYTGGISQEIWARDIKENLFPTNEYLLSMQDMSEYVTFKTVHIPQAGAAPNVVKNRSKGGAPVNTNLRTDTLQDFSIDEYTTDPFLITNVDEVELSYNKRESVLYEQNMKLRQVIGDNILIDIAPTGTATLPDTTVNANILRSSGITNNDVANISASVAYTPGATGNRLNFTLWDIRQAKKMFDTQNVPREDRAMVMSPDAADQIISDLIVTKFRQDAMNVFDTKSGNIDMLLGFKIYIRSQVCQYDNTVGTPVVKAYGAAGAATDNDAIIFFQKAFVARAIGDIHVYETLNSAVNYGDVYSGLIRMGASKVRSSELGLGAIVQTASV